MKIYKTKKIDDSLLQLLLLADPSEKAIRKYLAEGECFVSVDGSRIIGTYVLMPRSNNAMELINIAVIGKEQGKGLGKLLLKHAIKEARRSGAKRLFVGTGNSSLGQLAFYQKAGFRMTKIIKGYFLKGYDKPIFENGIQCVDMVRMEMELNN